MVINVHGGHNRIVPGASGYLDEVTEDRAVTAQVIDKLRALGHTVYDCTDDSGHTQSQNLANIVHECNARDVDLNVSIHFNAGGGTGTEVLVYSDTGAAAGYAVKICAAIAELGYRNRGVKERKNLYVLRHTTAPALLVECCFVDSVADAQRFDANKMAAAIVRGITGQTAADTGSAAETTTQAAPAEPQSGKLTVDGEIGAETIKAFQRLLGTPVDGYISGQPASRKKYWPAICDSACGWTGGKSQFVAAMQSAVGASVDGSLGKGTARSLQSFLRSEGFPCSVDGVFGAESAEALQRWLNA